MSEQQWNVENTSKRHWREHADGPYYHLKKITFAFHSNFNSPYRSQQIFFEISKIKPLEICLLQFVFLSCITTR